MTTAVAATGTAAPAPRPPLGLLLIALVGVTAGALAGRRRVRRAARLDVLRAIATDQV